MQASTAVPTMDVCNYQAAPAVESSMLLLAERWQVLSRGWSSWPDELERGGSHQAAEEASHGTVGSTPF